MHPPPIPLAALANDAAGVVGHVEADMTVPWVVTRSEVAAPLYKPSHSIFLGPTKKFLLAFMGSQLREDERRAATVLYDPALGA